MKRPTVIAQKTLILLIRAYQVLLSPTLGGQCRFHPSCSAYAIEAISEHGSLKGLWLGLVRLAKCHPFHPGGVDLVPANNHFVSHHE